jgi:hypothetical protein
MATSTSTKTEHVHYSKGLTETRPIEGHKSLHLLPDGDIRLATGVVKDVTCPSCKRDIKNFMIA